MGVAVVALVIAGGLALPQGEDADPDRCRGVTRSPSPAVTSLAGLRGCAGIATAEARGTVRYDADGRCFLLDPADPGGPALIVWPSGSRPAPAIRPTVVVPDRSAGDDLRGGTVTVGDAVAGVGPALELRAVDRVSGPCRALVGDRVAAFERLRPAAEGG